MSISQAAVVRMASRTGRTIAVTTGLALTAPWPLPPAAWAASGTVTRESVAESGRQGDDSSSSPDLSADGRYLTFSSSASNLVPGDTNGQADIFVRDRHTSVVTRVSVSGLGTQANHFSFAPAISANGQHVSFSSVASNLVGGDTNGVNDRLHHDVFVHNRLTGETLRVNVASDGSEAQGAGGSFIPSSISADGRYVAFESTAPNLVSGDANGAADIFVRDVTARTTTRVNVASTVPPLPALEAIGHSSRPSLSDDGRYVAFESNAPNLVIGDTNQAYDVFVHDRATAVTTRVSVASGGSQADDGQYRDSQVPALSADGSTVAFRSSASDLVGNDRNGRHDIFVHRRATGITDRVSVASNGTEANWGSGDGNNLRVAAISADGTRVAFRSHASNLVAGDANSEEDIFVHGPSGTTRVSVDRGGGDADGPSLWPATSADGRTIAFGSSATDLVTGDSNGHHDVFVSSL